MSEECVVCGERLQEAQIGKCDGCLDDAETVNTDNVPGPEERGTGYSKTKRWFATEGEARAFKDGIEYMRTDDDQLSCTSGIPGDGKNAGKWYVLLEQGEE